MLRTWDVHGDQQFLPRTATVAQGPFVDVSSSADGRRWAFLKSRKPRSDVTLLDTVTGRSVTTSVRGEVDLGGCSPGAWRPDGRRFAVAATLPGEVSVLDARTGEMLGHRKVVPGQTEIWSLGYLDAGRRLAIGDSTRHLAFVDAETLLPSGPGFAIASDSCVVVTADGRTGLFFHDSADGGTDTWRLVDIGSGKVLREGAAHQRVVSAAFAPDGKHAAMTGEGAEVLTLDVATGRLARSPSTSNAKRGLWVRWSPDGKQIVSGASDGTASLWDADSLQLLGSVTVPGAGVGVSPTFTRPHQVTLASYDDNIHQWDTDPGRIRAFACQMAGRNPTRDEWTTVLPDRPYETTCPAT